MLSVSHCLGVKWIKDDSKRGVFCQFGFYKCQEDFRTKTAWSTLNPKFNFLKQLTVKPVTAEFLNYLQTHALVIQLWGTQGSGGERRVSSISPPEGLANNRSKDSNTLQQLLATKENEIRKLQKKLKQQEEGELTLKEAYDASRKEIFRLKQKVEKLGTARNAKTALKISKHFNGTVNGTNSSSPSPPPIRPASASVNADIAKALKVFFKDVKGVQQELKHHRQNSEKVNSEDAADKRGLDQLHCSVVKIDESLSACVALLKSDVTAAIRTMKRQSGVMQ